MSASNQPSGTANVQRRTLTEDGNTVGASNVSASQNASGRESEIFRVTGPRKFDELRYRGATHYTDMTLRYRQDHTVTSASNTGDRTVSLNGDLRPVDAEKDIDDQPSDKPVIVVFNVTQGQEIPASALTLDYAANVVTVAEPLVNDADDLAVFPLIQEGSVQYRGENQFNQFEGVPEQWGTPVARFSEFDTNRSDTEIHMQGSVTWGENEHLVLLLTSDLQVVWNDADFPNGDPSHIEQEVDVVLG